MDELKKSYGITDCTTLHEQAVIFKKLQAEGKIDPSLKILDPDKA